jgi:ATP-dependent Clp protease protease subunit
MEYPNHVTVKIDGIAASAASVVAMAGSTVFMSPVSMMMVHNPATIAIGDAGEMIRTKAMLDEYKESIINAYELKTGISRVKLSHMMNDETWMNAHKAVELAFADEVLYSENEQRDNSVGMSFSRMAVTNSLIDKFTAKSAKPKDSTIPNNTGIPIETLDKRLSLILH